MKDFNKVTITLLFVQHRSLKYLIIVHMRKVHHLAKEILPALLVCSIYFLRRKRKSYT